LYDVAVKIINIQAYVNKQKIRRVVSLRIFKLKISRFLLVRFIPAAAKCRYDITINGTVTAKAFKQLILPSIDTPKSKTTKRLFRRGLRAMVRKDFLAAFHTVNMNGSFSLIHKYQKENVGGKDGFIRRVFRLQHHNTVFANTISIDIYAAGLVSFLDIDD